MGFRVTRSGNDANLRPATHQFEDAWDDGVIRRETLAIIVQGNITIKGDQFERPIADYAHYLSCVEDESDVVEGWWHKTSHADETPLILPDECIV
jgi:hypothetical protein